MTDDIACLLNLAKAQSLVKLENIKQNCACFDACLISFVETKLGRYSSVCYKAIVFLFLFFSLSVFLLFNLCAHLLVV